MSNLYTADPHFYHPNLITKCNLPFKNDDHKTRVIIRNWNSVVTDDDDVYIVGDFTMLSAKHRHKYVVILNKLKGRKHLVNGNHDQNKTFFYAGDYGVGFASIHYPYVEVGKYILCHDPSLAAIDRSRWFLCGHVHDLFKIQKNVINVGVNVWDWTPVSETQLDELIKENPL